MASKKAQLEHLRNATLFQGCSTKDLERIAKASDEITMPAGSLIVDQGQTGREAFIVLSGTVVVKRNNKKVGSFGPGTAALVRKISQRLRTSFAGSAVMA